jgi:hypothetical protein
MRGDGNGADHAEADARGRLGLALHAGEVARTCEARETVPEQGESQFPQRFAGARRFDSSLN